MRILFWNILHGGGPTRTPEIILTLLEQRADVIALCEFRIARGSQIRAALADHGYVHQRCSHRKGRSNGMLVASRATLVPAAVELPAIDTSPLAHDFAGREIDVRIESSGLHLTALHIADDASLSLKAAHWNRVIALARARRDVPYLILGDLNTARREETGSPLACAQRLGVLASLGYRDLWRESCRPGEQSPTWTAPWGEGRRIDAAWLSAPVARGSCLHLSPGLTTQTGQRSSDHAALVVDLC
jgi:exonuclease III